MVLYRWKIRSILKESLEMEEQNLHHLRRSIMQWTIRNLLNPVITRCLINGVNPFDLEAVLSKMEEKPLLNARMLDNTWMTEWKNRADRFIEFAEEEQAKGNSKSVSEYYMLAERCYYACYLLNSDLIENKKQVYENLSFAYREFIMNSGRRAEEVDIPFGEGLKIPAYLHLPDEREFRKPYPCVMIFTGMGSCKEEVEIEAKPLIERGVAVLAADMPGTGQALFQYGLKMRADNIEKAIDGMIGFCSKHPLLDANKLGTYGLCMGGGFAYRAAAKHEAIKCCVNLFPLFLSMLEEKSVPRWMKQGIWAEYQMGDVSTKEFIEEMAVIAQGQVSCKYLLVHSVYDNWMELEKTSLVFNKSTGFKKEILVEEKPVYATEESVMHAMPVGEQMHWIKRKAADFCREAFRE